MNRVYQIALTKVKGLGVKNTRTFLSHFESIEDIFESSPKEIQKISGIPASLAQEIRNSRYIEEAEEELEFVDKNKIEVLWFQNKTDFPRRLSHCPDAPLLLYYKGKANLNAKRTVSIVGTRNATPYGLELCQKLVAELAHPDTLIVSGLAYGIDVQAHRSSVEHDVSTIGVLGHGLDRVYPHAHREIAKKMIIRNGGLLTEFPSGTRPDRVNFPMRNRIIAGMADVVVVVEAAIKGGALITAEIANGYNRDVCTFPGSVRQPFSEGCNYLIKTNRAHLIRDAKDLYYLMNWEKEESRPKEIQLPLFTKKLNKDESKVMDYILSQEQDVHIDQIANHCAWPQSKLAIILLEMELAGHILSLPGKMFRIKN